jgi:GT2 family glycosyltransferase
MQTRPSVSVVIPSWNSEKQLQKNLPSVFAAANLVDAEIIVIDDHSVADNSVAFLESLGTKIKLIKNPTNLGFSATVNLGVARSQGDIVILLNTDVRPSPDCFANCLKLFSDPSIFAVTFNSNGSWAGGWWKDGLLEHGPISVGKSHDSLWASGGQAAFDRRKWEGLGGMDPLYQPFYWEDVDLGYRSWKRGWQIVWDPSSQCVHDHDESVIAHHHSPDYINSIAQRNQFLFVWKNIHDPAMIKDHLAHLPGFIKNYPLALCSALLRLPQALTSRKVEKQLSIRSDQEILSLWQNH